MAPRQATPTYEPKDLTDIHRVVRTLRAYAEAAKRAQDSLLAGDPREANYHAGRADGVESAIRCVQQEFGLAELKMRPE